MPACPWSVSGADGWTRCFTAPRRPRASEVVHAQDRPVPDSEADAELAVRRGSRLLDELRACRAQDSRIVVGVEDLPNG